MRAVRRRLLLTGWLAAGVLLLGKSALLQLVEGSEWRAEAERQHRAQGEVPAPRGSILDRDGAALAMSHEAFRVGVAPHELRDRDDVAEILVRTLDIPSAEARRVTRSERRWVQLPDRYPPSAREALAGVRGVYVERELRRFYPHGGLARGILGVVIDDLGTGGIEQEFEDLLRGRPGSRIVPRDSEGRPMPGESWLVTPPVPGGQVVLTLDRDLQEIASEALRDAIAETGARGGDLLVSDPRTGEILAMVSIHDASNNQLGGVNTPYEPGSTLKPFTVASLLGLGRATMADSVDTGYGSWTTNGRTLTDVSAVGKVTLAHALRVSSNVGIAKVAARLRPAEQYEGLRDFGFGVPTGIPLPGEASGTLRHPRNWSAQSAVSLAIGYEISVTPIQMLMAYGALANGGVLMEPRLIRELRAPDGRVLEHFAPRAVRQVVTPEVAAEVNRTLVEAVEAGTGTRARLATFAVAGKSGTSRATAVGGGYETGAYFASFVGFFPAEAPQLVVFVKLDRPRGAYYGGATAAPVTRATMEAVLAARRPPLDREALAAIARGQETVRAQGARTIVAPGGPGAMQTLFATRDLTDAPRDVIAAAHEPAVRAGGPAPFGDPATEDTPAAREGVPVPDVRGVPVRAAARRLHGAGFQVVWDGGGGVRATVPAAGTLLLPGDTVRLVPESTGSGPPGMRPAARGGP